MFLSNSSQIKPTLKPAKVIIIAILNYIVQLVLESIIIIITYIAILDNLGYASKLSIV